MIAREELTYTWYEKAILVMLYLNKGEMSKQKICELLYLIYRELEKVDSLEDLEFYLNMKTKRIEITTPDRKDNIDDIFSFLSQGDLVEIKYKNKDIDILLTKKGQEFTEAIIQEPALKNEVDIIIDIFTRFKDFSEQGLINLILENLKHSNIL